MTQVPNPRQSSRLTRCSRVVPGRLDLRPVLLLPLRGFARLRQLRASSGGCRSSPRTSGAEAPASAPSAAGASCTRWSGSEVCAQRTAESSPQKRIALVLTGSRRRARMARPGQRWLRARRRGPSEQGIQAREWAVPAARGSLTPPSARAPWARRTGRAGRGGRRRGSTSRAPSDGVRAG